MTHAKIPKSHPRAASLRVREKLIEGFEGGLVATSGLIAHGRGEAFDYLLGEKTSENARMAIEAAAAMLLLAENPVISVNGNVAALVPADIVKLAEKVRAKIEVNLFYRSEIRERAIAAALERAGASKILGVGEEASAKIPELSSERRRVDPRGILTADIVLIPLEDGDRTEALVRMGKRVIAIDLNPLSRTAQQASITIVDNIVRAVAKITEAVVRLRTEGKHECRKTLRNFDNKKNLCETTAAINEKIAKIAAEGRTISFPRRER